MLEQLFFSYIVVAVTYNLLSMAFKECTTKQLSPSEPLPSITMLTALYLVFASNEIAGIPDYARSFLLVAFALIIIRYGILRHLINYEPNLYFSVSSRISAAMINIFGISLLAINLMI